MACPRDPAIDAQSEIPGFCGQAAERRLVLLPQLIVNLRSNRLLLQS
jgi:hypothetical protein